MKPEKLTTAYRNAVTLNQTAIEAGKPRKANRAADRLVRLWREIRSSGPEVQRAFLELLEDEDLAVRACAARDALEIAPEQAVAVLRKLAAEAPFPTNFGAKSILEQWEAGTLWIR